MTIHDDFKIPFDEMNREILKSSFGMLNILLNEQDNPFVIALSNCFDKEIVMENVRAMMTTFQNAPKDQKWTIKISELHEFYILMDLTMRTQRAGIIEHYYTLASEMSEKYIPLDTELWQKTQNYTADLAENMLDALGSLKKQNGVWLYVWSAKRFPNPFTGISMLLESYNHIPNIPENPPQMSFAIYGEEIVVNCPISKKNTVHVKNVICSQVIAFILADGTSLRN